MQAGNACRAKHSSLFTSLFRDKERKGLNHFHLAGRIVVLRRNRRWRRQA